MNSKDFTGLIMEKGKGLYRPMPWREDTRPYFVLVSELMLQQTQVERVVPKFEAFIERFPDEKALAQAALADVLALWNGLGYNRRAKFLHEAAKKIVSDFNGRIPQGKEALLSLPGVGKNTAGAILAYAFNQPALFIETNIRSVYFYHFFPQAEKVDDKEIMELLAKTIDNEHPREFYWAMMDYGTWLKKHKAGNVGQSKHYKKQSALKGGVREVRGQIIRHLVAVDKDVENLKYELEADERFERALAGLIRDGLVRQSNGRLHLTK